MLNILENLLKDTKDSWIQGNNVRIYWQPEWTEMKEKVTEATKSLIEEGWKVVTWKKSKAIELYHGANLVEAVKIFEEHNK